MSRRLVLVSVFLALLPLMMVSAKAPDDDPFGSDAPRPAEAKSPSTREVETPKPAESKPAKPQDDGARPKPHPGPVLHGGEKAILKALEEETSIWVSEAPLKVVLEYFSEKHHIPIVMDSPALKEAGVEDSTNITKDLSGVSLRSALAIILDELQLKWVIHHNVLMVTSPTKAESDEYMLTKLYDVTDLLAQRETTRSITLSPRFKIIGTERVSGRGRRISRAM